MRFDQHGNRVTVSRAPNSDSRELAYWFEQEKVDAFGFCDEPIDCDSVTHLCSRFKGHDGRCAAVHKEVVGGRKVRRVEFL